MKRFLLFLCVLLLFANKISAQSKLNIDLYRWLQHSPPDSSLALLIKGKATLLRHLTEKNGGYFKYQAGNIASVVLPADGIKNLLNDPHIERMEVHFAPMHSLYAEDSAAFYNNNLSPAHQGWADLPHGFQGEGVLVGIIDDGFEWQHPDFQDTSGNTRVQYLWDQNANDPFYPETLFGYGASWDGAAIDNNYCIQVPGDHGSHVAGIAAGNGLAANKFVGVAPKSDLLWVKILEGSNWMPAFVDGLSYMYQKADELGKACAINSSLGVYSSGHDGKDLYSQYITNLIENRPGRAFVQAGGNARDVAFHIGSTVSDTAYTWFKYHAGGGGTHFLIYADTADFNQLDFSLQWINSANQQTMASTQKYNILRDLPIVNGGVAHHSELLFYDAQGRDYSLDLYASEYMGTYEIYVRISSPYNSHYWQFKTEGTGKYDIWTHPSLIGTSEAVDTGAGSRYRSPDNLQTIAGYWACAESVITVAAYQNRNNMISYTGDTTALNPNAGDIWYRSSIGPSRDGRQKPDLAAPGAGVLSAVSLASLDGYRNILFYKLDSSGWHISNAGTSMAAPMVAGAAALYFQCNPAATQSEIKTKLQLNARIDSFVLSQSPTAPNIHFGYGKLDVFNFLKSCLIYGCMDTAAVNYNPDAMVEDSSCVVFPPVNITTQINTDFSLQVLPNFVSDATQLQFRSPNNAQLSLWNSLGQCLERSNIGTSGVFDWNRNNLPDGTYWWQLTNESGMQLTQKMILIR